MSKLASAISMLEILSSSTIVSRETLSQKLEISPRAVQRLKDDIQLAGYEITSVYGVGGGYRLNSRLQIKPRAFTEEEIRVLQKALSFLINQDLSALDNQSSKVIAKLVNQFDEYELPTIEHIQSIKLNIDPKLYQKHLRILEEAVQSQTRVKIRYNKNHRETNTYNFEPYNLIVVNKFWYLVGNEYPNGRYLSLKVNRMETIETLDEMYRFDEETSRKSAVSNFGYKIKPTHLKCLISNRDYLSEYLWGENQVIEWIDNHKFSLSVVFSNENAAKDFILQNGSSIEIIEPPHLIEWHKDEIQKILKQYY